MDGKLVGINVDRLLVGPLTINLTTDSQQLGTLTGYKLQATSPLKDKGLNIQSLFKINVPLQDLYGNAVFKGVAPEPGVHELD